MSLAPEWHWLQVIITVECNNEQPPPVYCRNVQSTWLVTTYAAECKHVQTNEYTHSQHMCAAGHICVQFNCGWDVFSVKVTNRTMRHTHLQGICATMLNIIQILSRKVRINTKQNNTFIAVHLNIIANNLFLLCVDSDFCMLLFVVKIICTSRCSLCFRLIILKLCRRCCKSFCRFSFWLQLLFSGPQ